MKLIQTLFESDEDRMIAKAKQVYKAFKKGRGMVKVAWYPPVDVSYELPDIIHCEFEVRPSWEDEGEYMGFITMQEPVKYKIHNLVEVFGEEADNDYIVSRHIYDIGYVYRKKFDQFNIAIEELF